MKSFDITKEVNSLIAAGYTIESISQNVSGITGYGVNSCRIDTTNGKHGTMYWIDGRRFQNAVIALARKVAAKQQPRRPHCDHYETSNSGVCYDCGAYVASDDIGRFFK